MSSSALELGPLTTTFSPPPECSSVWLYYDSVLGVNGYWGESCVSDDVAAAAETGVYASSCYPDGWAAPFADNYKGHPDKFAVFSPGVHCPVGWTAACSVERHSDDDGPTDTQSAMWSALKAGETGVGCCPTGYSCAGFTSGTLGYECMKTISAGDKVSGSSLLKNDKCGMKSTTITIKDKFINKNLYAPQLNLIHGSTKETETAGSGNGGGGQDKGDGDAADNGSGNGGLSKEAIIAIAVCVPLVAIAVGIAVFLVVRRKKRLAQAAQPRETMVPNDPSIKPELDGGSWGVAASPSGATGTLWQKPELDAVANTRSELRGSEVSPGYQHHVHELLGSEQVVSELAASGMPGQQRPNPRSRTSTQAAYEAEPPGRHAG